MQWGHRSQGRRCRLPPLTLLWQKVALCCMCRLCPYRSLLLRRVLPRKLITVFCSVNTLTQLFLLSRSVSAGETCGRRRAAGDVHRTRCAARADAAMTKQLFLRCFQRALRYSDRAQSVPWLQRACTSRRSFSVYARCPATGDSTIGAGCSCPVFRQSAQTLCVGAHVQEGLRGDIATPNCSQWTWSLTRRGMTEVPPRRCRCTCGCRVRKRKPAAQGGRSVECLTR